MKTGFYSKREHVRVDQLVEEYRAAGLNPDDTDEDVLYLRAYLEEQKHAAPDMAALEALISQVRGRLTAWLRERVEDDALKREGMRPGERRTLSVFEVLQELNAYLELEDIVHGLAKSMEEANKWYRGVEGRHLNLVKVEKIRAESRLKNAAAAQLDVFQVMLTRLRVMMAETIPSDLMDALDTRIVAEFKDVPRDLVEGGAVAQQVRA